MNQTNQPPSKSVPRWLVVGLLAAGLLLLIVVAGFIYLAASGRLSPVPAQTSPLSYPLAAPISPLAAVSPVSTAPPAPQASFDLIVLHTNDTWGYLLPCG